MPNFYLKRTGDEKKRPNPNLLALGELAINYNVNSPGAFIRSSDGQLVKLGPVHVGDTAPNANPPSAGQIGHSYGELWLDKNSDELKFWNGRSWSNLSVSGAAPLRSLPVKPRFAWGVKPLVIDTKTDYVGALKPSTIPNSRFNLPFIGSNDGLKRTIDTLSLSEISLQMPRMYDQVGTRNLISGSASAGPGILNAAAFYEQGAANVTGAVTKVGNVPAPVCTTDSADRRFRDVAFTNTPYVGQAMWIIIQFSMGPTVAPNATLFEFGQFDGQTNPGHLEIRRSPSGNTVDVRRINSSANQVIMATIPVDNTAGAKNTLMIFDSGNGATGSGYSINGGAIQPLTGYTVTALNYVNGYMTIGGCVYTNLPARNWGAGISAVAFDCTTGGTISSITACQSAAAALHASN